MIIRRMKEKDLEQVLTIERESFSMPWSYQDFLDATNENDQSYIKLYLVAEENETILGYCGLWGIAGEGQINNVCVRKEFRNQHVGYNMLQELIRIGKLLDLHAYTLEVRVSNASAIALYEHLGFEHAGVRKNFYEHPKEDAIIMWLNE